MENAKIIIAAFLKISPAEIIKTTVMDKSTIPGSILIHRMYAKLADEGYLVSNRDTITTYGDFLNEVNGKGGDVFANDNIVENKPNFKKYSTDDRTQNNISIGIDIEDIKNMPETANYRDETFYSENFTQEEISYCILQVDPRASFAGKFALKEAVVKADNAYKGVMFKKIEILNNEEGKPFFANFTLSMSHTDEQVVAVVVKQNDSTPESTEFEDVKVSVEKNGYLNKYCWVIALFALMVSLFAIGGFFVLLYMKEV